MSKKLNLYMYYTDPDSLHGDKNVVTAELFFANFNPQNSGKGYGFLTSDAKSAYDYAVHWLDAPFPEGEDAIALDGELAYMYAVNFFNGEWEKGEDAIAKTFFAKQYRRNIEKTNGR